MEQGGVYELALILEGGGWCVSFVVIGVKHSIKKERSNAEEAEETGKTTRVL